MLRLATGRQRIHPFCHVSTPEGILKWIYSTQRHRSGGHRRNFNPSMPRTLSHGSPPAKTGLKGQKLRREFQKPVFRVPSEVPVIVQDEVIPYFQSNVTHWAAKPETLQRLISFGLPQADSRALLDHFAKVVHSGALSKPSDFEFYQLRRFSIPHNDSSIDTIYSTIFFWWASSHDSRGLLEKIVGIQPQTLDLLQNIARASDRSYPADEFPQARRNCRTIIMHVGPTNSGKTHHALRALAAAPTGVYAGPLRLLAHEIWERLNTGQILPLGVEPDGGTTSISHSGFGDARYRRLCNLITGEEQRFMGDFVPLHSCTIEMLQYRTYYDVAVVDEIQMLADEERANAWVNAVLGINAKEVHLCGEETAVPIVKELLKHTGDEVIVRRYERLSPLVVEENSLGDLSKVQQGDCIVTFKREAIFQLKQLVERKTGMRCAVVYGRLPPEIRSEQAARFNDPNSGYDVLIGSDAIGMGLNLKIKRIIFDTVTKWDGKTLRHLPVSAVKQIAGRAGRFGLHGSDTNLGGTVTTIHAEDLAYVRKCLAQPYEPLPCAYIGHTQELYTAVAQVLPKEVSMATVLEAPAHAGRLPPILRYSNAQRIDVYEFIDSSCSLTISERLMLLNAPIPWRDPQASSVIKQMLRMHQDEMTVKVAEIYRTPFFNTLVAEEKKMVEGRNSPSPQSLIYLEYLHKIVVFYLWMHYRFPVVYAEYVTASVLKARVEKVLTWCLENLSIKAARRKAPKPAFHKVVRPALTYMTKTEMRKQSMLGAG